MDYRIELPQLTATFPGCPPKEEILLLAGGRAPAPDWLRIAAKNRPLWCIDHGIDACFAAGLQPDRLIGDGDSADQNNWKKARLLGIPIDQFPPAKDLTDTQLALHFLQAEKPSASVFLSGAFGGRFDHAFSNMYSLTGLREKGFSACAADEHEVLFLLQGQEEIILETTKMPEVISLLPFSPQCQGVSIQNVQWPLQEVILSSSLPYAISNELLALNKPCRISLKNGCLGVYLHWK